MKMFKILAVTALAGTATFAFADEKVVTEDGIATFSTFKPAAVRAEVGTTGYGGAISWSPNPYVGVTLGYNGGDISWSDNVEVDDVNYDVDMENNLTYLNAEIRPWANWFYVAAGVGYVDQEYGLQARADGGNIEIEGVDTGLSQLSYDLDYDNKIAPYLGLGFSPAITNRWGVFGEVGAYYTGNPTVSNVDYHGGTPSDAALVEDHMNEVANDDKYEWMPVAKLGVSYRF
ncbi:ornithine uptake porin CarO [Acinetobacter sp.]|uniref:ornithine uptake porin CarO n=1 Tax=Acinetobacter sp. TaxID=472 RepID=UPI0035AD8F84